MSATVVRLLRGRIALLLVALALAMPAQAHQLRLGYLELQEVDAETYAVLWKLPAQSEKLRLALRLQWPQNCQAWTAPQRSFAAGALAERWQMLCQGGLVGQRIGVQGLVESGAEVLVRLQGHDGLVQNSRLNSSETAFEVSAAPGPGEIAGSYLLLGIEHILGGIDHLLFVFALLLIVRGSRRLILTISAFTLGHSITLGLSTLGLASLPSRPVEAVISLSIVFLALELLRLQRGQPSLTADRPWLVAVGFGLIHGFGFAGALQEVGMPQQAVALALLCFNLGVEAGQVLFVLGVLLLRRLLPGHLSAVPWLARIPPYAVGCLAMAWLLQRVT